MDQNKVKSSWGSTSTSRHDANSRENQKALLPKLHTSFHRRTMRRFSNTTSLPSHSSPTTTARASTRVPLTQPVRKRPSLLRSLSFRLIDSLSSMAWNPDESYSSLGDIVAKGDREEFVVTKQPPLENLFQVEPPPLQDMFLVAVKNDSTSQLPAKTVQQEPNKDTRSRTLRSKSQRGFSSQENGPNFIRSKSERARKIVEAKPPPLSRVSNSNSKPPRNKRKPSHSKSRSSDIPLSIVLNTRKKASRNNTPKIEHGTPAAHTTEKPKRKPGRDRRSHKSSKEKMELDITVHNKIPILAVSPRDVTIRSKPQAKLEERRKATKSISGRRRSSHLRKSKSSPRLGLNLD